MADLFPITVYLSRAEVAALELEAAESGQSGVSSRIRWILQKRRENIEYEIMVENERLRIVGP